MRTTTGHVKRAWWAGAALAPAVLAPASVSAGTQMPASATTGGTAVLVQWNTIAQANSIALRPTAHGTMRGIAMVQGAVYDAVNAIEGRYQPYLLDSAGLPVDDASVDAAIATAARDVLAAIGLPEQIPDLDAAYQETLAAIEDGPGEDAGVAVGAAAAAAMLADRADDGFMAPFEFVIGDGPGAWRPATSEAVDPDPWVGNLDPFTLERSDQFPSAGPNELTSAEYTADYNEVLELGALDSTTRTEDQTTAAIFWQTSPIAIWNTLARDLAAAQGLDVADAARLLAMVDLAGADGAIACWNDKYRWNFWRPLAAIHEADTDGNPDTAPDPNWQSLFDPATPTEPPLGTPPFPDHPSGHTCLSGSVLYVLEGMFGSDVAFDIHSGRFPDQPRHFDNFMQALDEIIDARVWGGIHFRTADVQGAEIGDHVATWLSDNFFQPAGNA